MGLKYTLPGSATVGSIKLIDDGSFMPRIVRTGTGQIDLAATGDLVLGDQFSVIYTAGVSGPGIRFPGLPFDGGLSNLPFPHRGGDINIDVGRDVVGAKSSQMIADWQWRTGCQQAETACNAFVSTAWTVNFEFFQQGIATLGGGSVDIDAGRNVSDLWTSSASIGRQVGGISPAQNQVELAGGGDVSVRAGGDFVGGGIYVGRGKGRIDVLGSFLPSADLFTGMEIGPLLAGRRCADRGDVTREHARSTRSSIRC